MIEEDRESREFEVSCDKCPNECETFDTDDGWQAMIDQLRKDGWKIYKDEKGEWTHIGPACSEVSSNPFDLN